jgi:hypothetical protein
MHRTEGSVRAPKPLRMDSTDRTAVVAVLTLYAKKQSIGTLLPMLSQDADENKLWELLLLLEHCGSQVRVPIPNEDSH